MVPVAPPAALGQAPGFRMTYGVRVLARADGDVQPVASGSVSGPQDTDLRLALHSDSADVEALLDVVPELEITVTREFVGGETRPVESFTALDSAVDVAIEAVVRPRRAAVRLTLERGDSTSAPQLLDMVPEAAARRVTFVLGRRTRRTLEVTLTRPDPPVSGRDRALALDADVVCLRVADPATPVPAWVRCGRLNNVARRIPLSERDTLVATFAWPAAR